MSGGRQQRREPRFETKIWVGIPEAEGDPEVESCNISASGMFLRTSRDAGTRGAVRMLRLVSADLGASIEILAHVVRVEEHEDPALGRVIDGTAFEFLPHHPRELEEFLSQVVEGEISVLPIPSPGRRPAADTSDPSEDAQPGTPTEEPQPALSKLNVSGMLLDANRPFERGTRMWLEIEMPSAHSRLRLGGRAVTNKRLADVGDEARYATRVKFEFGPEFADGPPDAASASVSAEASSGKRRQKQGVHLSRSLAEVSMPSLLGFFEFEKASGVLLLEQDSTKASIFVRDGCIVDVDSEPAESPALDRLNGLLRWPDGEFEFRFQSVERDDVIGTSTITLLLECARQSDEESA